MDFKQILAEKLQQALTATKIPPKFLVALSGGSDSTALLIGLNQITDRFNFQISACHINHHLRGKESDEDEFFCRQLCGSLNIELDILNADNLSSNSEEALRELRYQLLLSSAKKSQANCILTAHTLDDQIETVLFRLFRGTALKGASGINLYRKLSEEVYLLRPLLTVSKDDCQRFLVENSIVARFDSSNASNIYTRNYLRNEILPVIEARFPKYRNQLEQFREIFAADEAFLNNLTIELLKELEDEPGQPVNWPILFLTKQHLAIKRRLIAQALRDRDIEASYERVSAILSALDKKDQNENPSLTLNEVWQVHLTNAELRWQKKEASPSIEQTPVVVKVPGRSIALTAGHVLQIEALSADKTNISKSELPPITSNEVLVDLGLIKPPLTLRSRQPGDIIQPFGMSNKVRLKQYLHTHKSNSNNEKPGSTTIVLADQEEVIWVPGIGINEKLRIKEHPSHRLQWLPLASDLSLA